MVVQLAVDHFLSRSDDRLADLRIQPAQRHVGLGGGALDDAQRPDHRLGLLLPADLEIADRPLRLRAPIAGGVDLDRAESVRLRTRLDHGLASPCGDQAV
jgi:hypothetical protein